MRRIVSALLAFAVLATAAVMTITSKTGVQAVYAHSGCSVATQNGSYGFADSGFSALGVGLHETKLFPFAAVGVATFDRTGNATATFAASLNGSSCTDNPYTGTYTVNPDCTGLLTSTSGGDNFAVAVTSGGTVVFATDLSAGTTTTMELKKQ